MRCVIERVIFGLLVVSMTAMSAARLMGFIPSSMDDQLTFHLSTTALFFTGVLGLFFSD